MDECIKTAETTLYAKVDKLRRMCARCASWYNSKMAAQVVAEDNAAETNSKGH